MGETACEAAYTCNIIENPEHWLAYLCSGLSVQEDILIDYNLVGKEPGSVAVVLVGYHADVTRLAVVNGSVDLEEQGVVAFGYVAMDGGHVVIFAAIFRYIIIYLLRGPVECMKLAPI